MHKKACKQAKKKAKNQPKKLPYGCGSSESCEDEFDSSKAIQEGAKKRAIQADILYEAIQRKQYEEDILSKYEYDIPCEATQSKEHELDDGDKAWLKRNEAWLKQDAEIWAA